MLRYDLSSGGVAEIFIEQPTPSPESLGLVSFLGIDFGPTCDLGLPGQCAVCVSDFANDIRRDNLNGTLEAQLSTNYTGTSPSHNFADGLTFGALCRLFTVGFNNGDPAMPGTILRYNGLTNATCPCPAGTMMAPPMSQKTSTWSDLSASSPCHGPFKPV